MEDNRIFNHTNLNTLKEYIPLLVGASYISGAIVVNSFLSKYKIYSSSIFESEYLIAGAIFLLIFGILFLSIFFSNKHMDKLPDNPYDFYVPALIRVLLLSYTFCFLILDSTVISAQQVEFYNYYALGIIITFILINLFIVIKNLRRVMQIVILIIGNGYVYYISFDCRPILGLSLGYGFFWTMLISDMFERQFEKTQALGNLLVLVSLAMIFGYTSYDKIARRFGGGKPESIVLLLKGEDRKLLPPGLRVSSDNSINALLVHSTANEYSIEQDSIVLTLSKELFTGYRNNLTSIK